MRVLAVEEAEKEEVEVEGIESSKFARKIQFTYSKFIFSDSVLGFRFFLYLLRVEVKRRIVGRKPPELISRSKISCRLAL